MAGSAGVQGRGREERPGPPADDAPSDLTNSEQRFPLSLTHPIILGGNLCFAALGLSLVQGYPFWQILRAGVVLLM